MKYDIRIASLVFLISSWLVSSAQEFHAEAMFQCKGNIESITYEEEKPYVDKTTYHFQKSGRLTPSSITYDPDGYPMQIVLCVLGNVDHTVFEWGDDHRLLSVSTDNRILNGAKWKVEYKYDSESSLPVGMLDVEWKRGKNDEPDKMVSKTEYTYSSYEFDDHGNWISRNVCRTVIDGKDADSSPSTYIERRRIQYY